MVVSVSFGIIQNNIALKQIHLLATPNLSFGIIQNNIALKLMVFKVFKSFCFGIIQNNIALKPRGRIFPKSFVIALLILAGFQF